MTIPWQMHLFASSSIAALMVGGAVDSYAVGGNSPPVVADFVNEYYRVGGSVSDFPTMFSGTTTRSDLATMVDSDEVIKWCPHNLILQSNDFTTTWAEGSYAGTMSQPGVVSPDGTTNAWLLVDSSAGGSNVVSVFQGVTVLTSRKYTFSIWMKQNGLSWAGIEVSGFTTPANGVSYFNLGSGVVGTASSGVSSSIQSFGSDWYLCSITFTTDSSDTSGAIAIRLADSDGDSVVDLDGTSSIYIYGAHFYRSSLGGMANVPSDMRAASALASYVTTTTAAKYLQRRGHHIYNGSTWDNKGILLETEARTNICTQSVPATTSGWTATTGATSLVTNPLTGASDLVRYTPSNATSSNHRVYITGLGALTAATHCVSMFVQAGTSDPRYLHIRVEQTASYGVCIDLTNGSLSTCHYAGTSTATAFTTQGVVDYGNGIYRVWGTFTAIAATANILPCTSDSLTTTNWTPTGSEYCHMWGVQLELGSTPSSYIPTAGATVSRSADSLVIPAANMSYSATDVSYQMSGTVTYADDDSAFYFWSVDSGTQDQYAFLNTSSTRTGKIQGRRRNDAGTSVTIESTANVFTPGVNKAFNQAWRMSSTNSNVAVALDGTRVASNGTVTGDSTQTADMYLFSLTGASGMNGVVSQFRQWNVDLGDSGIATAST